MEKIPITFEHEGKQYSGNFTQVSGSGNTSIFHLMIENYYKGQLVLTDNHGWQFYNNKGEFAGKENEFGEYVLGWYH